jgi:hypothetical protein
LGEHQLDKLGVTGSSPVPPIADRNPACFSQAMMISIGLFRFDAAVADAG